MWGAFRSLLFALIALGAALFGTAANASWGFTLNDGCGRDCPSVQAVCDYWGTYYHGCAGIDGPVYNVAGQPVAWHFRVVDDPPGGLNAFPVCQAPQVADVFSPSGCSNFTPPPPKQLGQYCPGSACAGDPFRITTGNLYESFTDFTTVGADPLAFIRYYNSQSERYSNNNGSQPLPFSLGVRWRSNFDSYIDFMGAGPGSTTEVFVAAPDGAEYQFLKSGGVWVSATSDVDASLTTDGATLWTYTDRNDTAYNFDFNTGVLQSIKNRSGYQQNLSYDANELLPVSWTPSLGATWNRRCCHGTEEVHAGVQG